MASTSSAVMAARAACVATSWRRGALHATCHPRPGAPRGARGRGWGSGGADAREVQGGVWRVPWRKPRRLGRHTLCKTPYRLAEQRCRTVDWGEGIAVPDCDVLAVGGGVAGLTIAIGGRVGTVERRCAAATEATDNLSRSVYHP